MRLENKLKPPSPGTMSTPKFPSGERLKTTKSKYSIT
jgi:hypothetical protein